MCDIEIKFSRITTRLDNIHRKLSLNKNATEIEKDLKNEILRIKYSHK